MSILKFLVCASLATMQVACSQPDSIVIGDEPSSEDFPGPRRGVPTPGGFYAAPPVPVLMDPDIAGENLVANGGFEEAIDVVSGERLQIREDDVVSEVFQIVNRERFSVEAPYTVGRDVTLRPWELSTVENVRIDLVDSHVAEGNFSLHAELDAGSTFRISQTLHNQGHTTYLGRAVALSRGMSAQSKVIASYSSGEGQVQKFESAPMTSTKPVWQALETRFEIPATVSEFEFAIICKNDESNAEHSGQLWLDECSVFPVSTPLRANLLDNGTLGLDDRNALVGWEWWKDHEIANVSDENFPTILRVICEPSQPVVFVQNVAEEIEPGKEYVLRGYVKSDGDSGELSLAMEAEEGLKIAESEIANGSNWTFLSAKFKADHITGPLLAVLRYRPETSRPTSPATVYFAHVELIPVTK